MKSAILVAVSLAVAVFASSLLETVDLLALEPPISDSQTLHWLPLPDLPDELGVAGPFVGVHGDALIVAGGANFSQPVWANSKVWHDQIWVLGNQASGMQWKSGGALPRALGYGATVSSDQGVICMGGNDQNQLTKDVFVLNWNAARESITHREFPALPRPCAYGQATLVGNMIYLAGGQSASALDSAMNNFWCLDLSKQNEATVFCWQPLEGWPAEPRAFNITTHQHNGQDDCIYVIGGRCQVATEVRFLKDVWEYNPRLAKWRQRADLPHGIAAGAGIGFGEQNIIYVLAGDDGSLFSKTDELKDLHPGFLKEALTFNTRTNIWTIAGTTPQSQVTTTPVIWNKRIIIASGEIRPRVRTASVWSVSPSVNP